MMSETTNFQNTPLKMTLKAGKKFAYCTCGHANTFPNCDGSHRTYGGKPIKFTPEKETEVMICRCGKSKELPYCDSSHINPPVSP